MSHDIYLHSILRFGLCCESYFGLRAHGRAANDNQSGVFLKIASYHDHGLNLDRNIIERGLCIVDEFPDNL